MRRARSAMGRAQNEGKAWSHLRTDQISYGYTKGSKRMKALFLYLDEQLGQGGLNHYGRKYSAPDLAFWLQFYSLFYDEVYVPANFLLDNDATLELLTYFGVPSGESSLNSSEGAFRILWDTSRFSCESFQELLALTSRDPYY